MRYIILLIFIGVQTLLLQAQLLPGFKPSGLYNEQQFVIEDSPANTRILINAPLEGFGKDNKVLLIFYALPNGNSIEQTFGKNLKEGDDWHFNIQHIGAQARFLRNKIKDQTIVVVYLEAKPKSWSMWMGSTHDSINKIKKIVDDVKLIFKPWKPRVIMNSHSGGGRFIFSYIIAADKIPDDVDRISFIDSDYGYEDTIHGPRIVRWIKSGEMKYLCTLAYNDSVVIYEGKQLVSPTGGTWYRSKMMEKYLSDSFPFEKKTRYSIIWYTSLKNRIEILLRKNPRGKIYHTRQVEYNGFIHSNISGTDYEKHGYRYFGRKVYRKYISDSIIVPIRSMNISPRSNFAESGSAFMNRIDTLAQNDREEEIFNAVASGNVPAFLRNTITINAKFADSTGVLHKIVYEVMPDYLAVGNDSDFCRIPMNPHTAQRLATLFGASLLTSKISDEIYKKAEVRLSPFNYIPVGHNNELVSKFREHNDQIEKQLKEAGGKHGQLIAGIKKDVILSARLADKPNKVVIYGWHKPDGKPIQPVYSGHVDWYVDYSHGIRLINNQVLVDGKPLLFSDILKDPVLYKIFSNEERVMGQSVYPDK